jgi:uncharacterized protein
MRRDEREIKKREEIEAIIQQAQVCRIGLSAQNVPYIVPVNFGYNCDCLYFHCTGLGKKIDTLCQNNRVCFEVDIDFELRRPDGPPCHWGANYRSVIGFGWAFLIDDQTEKSAALNIICQHYGTAPHDFSADEVRKVTVVRIKIDSLTGKKAGY